MSIAEQTTVKLQIKHIIQCLEIAQKTKDVDTKNAMIGMQIINLSLVKARIA